MASNTYTRSTNDMEEPVTLQSKEGVERVVEADVVRLSVTIRNLLEDAGADNPIPLLNIDTVTMDRLLEYLNYHHIHPEEHTKYKGKGLDEIGDWDLDFCSKMDNGLLFKVILASNYLDIEPLLHLTCKTVAKMIKGKKPEEIKQVLKIEVDNE